MIIQAVVLSTAFSLTLFKGRLWSFPHMAPNFPIPTAGCSFKTKHSKGSRARDRSDLRALTACQPSQGKGNFCNGRHRHPYHLLGSHYYRTTSQTKSFVREHRSPSQLSLAKRPSAKPGRSANHTLAIINNNTFALPAKITDRTSIVENSHQTESPCSDFTRWIRRRLVDEGIP